MLAGQPSAEGHGRQGLICAAKPPLIPGLGAKLHSLRQRCCLGSMQGRGERRPGVSVQPHFIAFWLRAFKTAFRPGKVQECG